MKAEVVAIGSELTSGAKLDTNSQWLSLELANLGIPVAYHTTMADSLEAMTEVFRIASGRCDLVLITGGLGPTLDDITRDALAALTGVELVLDDACLAHITDLFSRRNRPMPDRNRVQAMLPEGSRAIENPRGTAPDCAVTPRFWRSRNRIWAWSVTGTFAPSAATANPVMPVPLPRSTTRRPSSGTRLCST